MKVDLGTFAKYRKKGLLKQQRHQSLPLTIWNYTEKAKITKVWNDVTKMCRALVVDDDGKVVARSFPAFFDIAEGRHKTTPGYVIQEKLDGSLVLLFHYADTWIATSRGSFVSEQAKWAHEMLQGRYKTDGLDIRKTYVFEAIYPKNRVIVDYQDRQELIYLASFYSSGQEVFDSAAMQRKGFPVVRTFADIDYTRARQLAWDNAEGFVVRFDSGDRCKVKFEKYINEARRLRQR